MKWTSKPPDWMSLLLLVQLGLTAASSLAGNDPPPSFERAWLPPNLSSYETELASRRFSKSEIGNVSIDSRKIYNLAELIDIAACSFAL